jgi:hypothetical protein
MCACTETDVRESEKDCTLDSGEGHSSRAETFHSLCAASPISSSVEHTVPYTFMQYFNARQCFAMMTRNCVTTMTSLNVTIVFMSLYLDVDFIKTS